jgi:hypothetical protein
VKSVHLLVAAIVLSLSSSAVLAGANNAELQCNAVSHGGLSLKGSIPGDFAEFDLTLKGPKGSISMSDKTNDKISVIDVFKHGVFTLDISQSAGRGLVLYAIPRTVKYVGGANREKKAAFDAVLMAAPIPGYSGPDNYDSWLHDVPFKCKYSFSI